MSQALGGASRPAHDSPLSCPAEEAEKEAGVSAVPVAATHPLLTQSGAGHPEPDPTAWLRGNAGAIRGRSDALPHLAGGRGAAAAPDDTVTATAGGGRGG